MKTRDPAPKRALDIFLSVLGICISLPVWIAVGVGILIEDGRPILIHQKRIGKGGKLIDVLKFRSMDRNALCEEVHSQAEENDPRVTRIGSIIRITAMDELPQLLNILRGDMSFVGPRALLPEELEINSDGDDNCDGDGNCNCVGIQDIRGYDLRVSAKPGLTGIAQIYAPRDVPRRNKFRYDIIYVKKRSFLLDIKLILLSFIISFRGRWECRGEKM